MDTVSLTLARPQMTNLLVFLNRVQIQGAEAQEFIVVQQRIIAALEARPADQPIDPQED